MNPNRLGILQIMKGIESFRTKEGESMNLLGATITVVAGWLLYLLAYFLFNLQY